MAQYGPKWPLKKGNEDLYEMYTEIKDQISFYMKNLLLTSKGENLSDPSYGVGIRSFLFEQNIESVRGAIQSEIQQQFAVYLSYVDIEDIVINASSADIDSNSLSVKISYRLPGQSVPDIFELESETSPTIGFY
jgi:phage baseplate assembly protein W